MTAGPPNASDRARILIYAASTGSGHRSAAASVESYLLTHYADSVHVRTVDFMAEHAPGINALARFAHDAAVDFFPTGYGTFGDLTRRMPHNPVVRELMTSGFANAEAFLKAFKPDAVISTHAVPGGVVSELSRSVGPVAATVVAEYASGDLWLHPDTDLYFVSTTDMRDDMVLGGVPYERVVVSGIPIDERFAERASRASCRSALGLSDRFTVLLTPTAGPVDDMRSLCRSLTGEGIQVAAVTGGDERLHRALATLAGKQPLLHPYADAGEMPAMMRAADVVVGRAGGLTVPEAFAAGVPFVAYSAVPGPEARDVRFIVTSGAGLEGRSDEDVLTQVRYLAAHPERLAQLASNASAMGRPAAARAVCERVLAALR